MTSQNTQKPQRIWYHRIDLADPKPRWWKPLAELGIGLLTYLLLNILLLAFLTLAVTAGFDPALGRDPAQLLLALDTESQVDHFSSPSVFLLVFLPVTLMFPALLLARLVVGPRPWGLINSVAGRMRWRWLATCLGLATVLIALIPLLFDFLLGASYQLDPALMGSQLTMMLVLILLVVPLQAYAEELVFRGYLMQTLGRWLKNPVWAIVLPAPLFMLGHTYSLWAQLSILLVGLVTGYITWRTGGLEAAIALHVVNNLLALLLGALGASDPFSQEVETPLIFVSSLLTQLVYLLAVVALAQRLKVQQTRLQRF